MIKESDDYTDHNHSVTCLVTQSKQFSSFYQNPNTTKDIIQK